ncbi:MAG TPA: transposase [bacterium]
MPRATRQLIDESYWHITVRGNNRRPLFHRPDDYRAYLRLLREYGRRFPGTLIHHYCLMPNQVHLLVRMGLGPDFPRFMQGVNQSYYHHYRRTHGYSGHLFQGRYKSFAIRTESYLLECGRYIERNPVRAEMVRDPRHYPWSSYTFYAEGQPDPLLTPSPLYEGLGAREFDRQLAYRDYVTASRPYEALIDRQLLGV